MPPPYSGTRARFSDPFIAGYDGLLLFICETRDKPSPPRALDCPCFLQVPYRPFAAAGYLGQQPLGAF
jgi:hypothetical protein